MLRGPHGHQPPVCTTILHAKTTPDLRFMRKSLEIPARAKNFMKDPTQIIRGNPLAKDFQALPAGRVGKLFKNIFTARSGLRLLKIPIKDSYKTFSD